MSTNLEYTARERQRKRESRRQASEAQREKDDRDLEREIKKQRRHYLLEEQHENFIAAVRKWEMLAATRVKMSGSQKKVNRTTYNISSIKSVTRKFLEVSRCSRAKQRQRSVQKKCAARAKMFFC